LPTAKKAKKKDPTMLKFEHDTYRITLDEDATLRITRIDQGRGEEDIVLTPEDLETFVRQINMLLHEKDELGIASYPCGAPCGARRLRLVDIGDEATEAGQ
jgi:hypothetical protein